MFKSYKEQAEINKEKIIRRDVKSFKKLCISKFHDNIERGKDITTVGFFAYVDYNFEDEISEIVLKELKSEHKGIEFSFGCEGFKGSYRNLIMKAL